jgi:hypothetical protein
VEILSEPSRLARREFMKAVGATAAAASGLASFTPFLGAAASAAVKEKPAEDFVKLFYESLKPEQREKICFAFDHPLGRKVANNWHIVPHKIGETFDADQQELIRQIFRGITTEDGYERFQKSMHDDDGGLANYSCALFGDPKTRLQWVLTGRHLTLRADGNSVSNAALGGPIFYGHAVQGQEQPDHPGNVWWHQGRLANQVFDALDGKQRERALLPEAPPDSDATVRLRGDTAPIPGLRAEELSTDQRELLEKTMKEFLAMFRESDVEEVMACLKRNGGLDKVAISFYKDGDLGDDGVWDRWRIEGPAFVWYFRGSPHVHTWVNVAHEGPAVL